MINAAVSHELRNPLNSLVSHMSVMMSYFYHFNQIIDQIVDIDLKMKLTEIYNSIYTSGKKMASSTKFIDFFVHDILDYTILNKNSKTFTKNISIFNVEESIKEIIDSLSDKTEMKDI